MSLNVCAAPGKMTAAESTKKLESPGDAQQIPTFFQSTKGGFLPRVMP